MPAILTTNAMIMAPAKLMVLVSVMLDFLAATVQVNSQRLFKIDYALGQAIGPLWDFCAPISIIVEF